MQKIIDNYVAQIKNFANIDGRATRSEYWYFFLVNMLISILLNLLANTLGSVFSLLAGLYSLLIFLPGITVAIRRMHDIGKSGWTLLVSLIPFIGLIWIIVLLALKSDQGENKYGPAPVSLKN